MSDEAFFKDVPIFDAVECSLQSTKEPARVLLCLKAENGMVLRSVFEKDLLQYLHKACMDALGMHYQTFTITGIEPKEGAT